MRPLLVMLVALAVLAGVGLAWCVGSGAARPTVPAGPPIERGGVPQGHVYTGCVEEPDDVNPFTAESAVVRKLVLGYTHEGLLAVDPDSAELRPALADFEPAADGASCVFTLREGVRFADGSAVTLDDVLFGWQLATAGHLPLGFVADAFSRVRDVETLDARRLRVHFKDRHYAALRLVGENWLVAKKQFFVDRVAARNGTAGAPPVASAEFATLLRQITHECGPGTGPYRLDNDPHGTRNWRPRQDLLLVANEHSWQRAQQPGTWNFAGIRLLLRARDAATNELLRREVDWFTGAAIGRLLQERPDLAEDYERLLYDYDSLGVYRAIWQCNRGPCADVRVRRALAMLFDVESLRRDCDGLGAPAFAHAKPDSGAYPQGLAPFVYDPSAARRLLREAGYDPEQGKPLRLVVAMPDNSDVLKRIGNLFADACRRAGVELDLRTQDWPAFLQEKKRGEWHGIFWLQYFPAWGDPWDLLHSEGLYNEGGWSDPAADRLADAARIERDPARRDTLWRELHAIVWREQPVALLVHPLASVLLAKRIQGTRTTRAGLVVDRAYVAHGQQRR